MLRFVLILSFALAISGSVLGQAAQRSLAERLGYSRDAKLLIVHADDLGMAHSVNAASIRGLESGQVNSASIMVPCPWFPEIAEYARTHPSADFGLHLTLTSEWPTIRWRPITPKERVSSLFDPAGYLYSTTAAAVAHLEPKQVEAELRAQIDRAIASGVRPTHLDSHMFTLYDNKKLFEVALRVARDYKLPLKVARDWFARSPFMAEVIKPTDIVIDRTLTIEAQVAPERWAEFYTDALRGLQPGVTELIIHLAYDNDEMRAATLGHPEWGSAWRQREFNFFTSEAFQRLLEENHIKLITWREIGRLQGR